MTEVLHSSQSSSPLSCAPSSSSSSSPTTTTTHNNNNDATLFCNPFSEQGDEREVEEEEVCSTVVPAAAAEVNEIERERRREQQLSLLAVLLTLFRKSFWMACKTDPEDVISNGMEIGWPTNVRHVAHVTFDRFNGFLGLPVEFEPEVPIRAPSARSSFFFFMSSSMSSSSSSSSFCSTTVFGVSTESMQLSFDTRGNSVPTILLLMQHRLYVQGGLQAEGIFRINPENTQEEFVREQLNRGILPQGIDVHTLAGLIKAWFRELPTGILDSLSPEQVTQSQSEEEYSALVTLLPSTQAALLSWAVNLMADVVQMEHLNKMNAHNVAMVFAPNMTQLVDPLTALVYAVQVMNFLKSLITKTLREREQDSAIEPSPLSCTDPPPPSDENGNHSPTLPGGGGEEEEHNEASFKSESNEPGNTTDGSSSSMEEKCESHNGRIGSIISHSSRLSIGQSSVKHTVDADLQLLTDKGGKGTSNLSRINSLVERNEAWR